MAKLTGRRQGLDQKKLAALEKVLKEVGINQQLRINSGLRDHAEVFRIYKGRLKTHGLDKIMPELPKDSADMVKQMILKVDYKGEGKPMKIVYPVGSIKKLKDTLEKQLQKDGVNKVKSQAIANKVVKIRSDFGGFASPHLRGEKIDIDRKLLRRPEVIDKLVEKGYVILDEISNEATGKGIFDISFPQSGRKGSYKRAGDKKDLSGPEMLRDDYLDDQKGVVRKSFKQAFDEARKAGEREFTYRKKRYLTRKENESVEDFEKKFKDKSQDQDIAIEQKKIIQEAKKPEQEIKAEDIQLEETIPMDQSVPFGVYAQGSNEFEMAEEQEKDKLMMAAEGGEVRYQEGGEVDVPEYLRRPEEDIEEEEFKVEDVTEMDLEEPDPFPKRDRSPDFQGVREYQLSQMSTDELMKKRSPGAGRAADVNRELSRRRRDLGVPVSQIAELEREEVVDVKVPKPEPEPKPARLSKMDFLDIRKLRDEKELRKAEDDAIKQAQQLSTIDPKRFYKNMSTFDKIVSLVGLAAGAYGSYKYGTPNAFVQRLDREVEKDIKAQALGAKLEQQKLAAANFKVSVLAKRLARSTKDVEKQQTFLKLSQQYQQKGLKEIKKEVKKRKDIRDLSELNKRGVSDEELAYITVNFPKLRIEDSVIKGRDGLNYRVKGGVSRANKVKEYVSDAQDSLDGLNELLTYVDKVTIFEQGALNPFAAILSEDRAKADSLRDRLVGKLRIEFFGPGVMTDQERAQAKKILGDPNAFFTTDVREKAKIRSLIMKLNYGVRNKLRADGVPLPASPNDLRIKQMLGRRRLSDNAANRVKVIDGLIQSETDSIENGNPSGQFWDINEPLPL
jgi:hypothetical protein